MALLSLSNISKSFADRLLFDNVSFTIENNHRIGLVGANGSGKTTLFKIIEDKIDYDSGEIFKSKNTKVGYVEQFICSNLNQKLYDEALQSFEDLINIEKELKDINEKLSQNANDSLLKRKHLLEETYQAQGGYVYESMTRSTLLGVGFKEDELDLEISKLSGGQKTKLMLAKMLLSKSNLLLLDEPTNNLDIDAIEWLENFLLNFKGSYLIISHDRYFLDKVTKETFELESKRLSIYEGNYSKYLKLKEERNKTLSRKFENTEKEIKRIEGIIEQQKTWSQERNYKIIKSKQKMIDRLEVGIELPDAETQKINFHFDVIAGGNQDVLTVKNLKKSFNDKVLFQNASLEVHKKERVFIIGPNGCGKTTLINILQNKLSKDGGTFYIGSNIKTAIYNQTQEELTKNTTILNYVWEKYSDLNQTEVRRALAVFLFKGEEVNKNILELSGGEKARIALLMIMLSKSNFLILDEPTNHLDITCREALENALSEYEGTLLIISHDRYFINKLATKIYRLDENGTREYKGNYDYFLSMYQPEIKTQVKTDSANKISYKEKKEKEALERKRVNCITKLEDEIASLEEIINSLEDELLKDENATDYEKAMEITNEIESQKKKLNFLYEEWESLQT